MSLLRNISNGFRSLFRRDAVNSDLDEELQAYLAGAIEENMRKGMTEEQAERAAGSALGGGGGLKTRFSAKGWKGAMKPRWKKFGTVWARWAIKPGFTTWPFFTCPLASA